MTIINTQVEDNYTAGAGAAVFAYTFRILHENSLDVYVDDVLQTLNSDYTVDGVNDDAGGNVTLVTPLAGGEAVDLIRDTAVTQATNYQELDSFPAESHEQALDKLTMQNQEEAARLDALETSEGVFNDHISDTDNPHSTTKALVGLGNADNTSDADKPISSATQSALDAQASAIAGKEDDLGNPSINGQLLSSTVAGVRSWTTVSVTSISNAIDEDVGDGSAAGDLNNTDYTGNPDAVGSALALGLDTVAFFTHKGVSYQWVGPQGVTVGVGGSHTALSGDLAAIGTAVPAFRGCLAFTTVNGAFGDGAFAAVGWDSNDYDTDNIHDLGGDTTLFTVPAGVSRIRLSGTVHATSIVETVNLRSVIQKNGGSLAVGNAANQRPADSGDVIQYQWETPVVNVTPGDTFNLSVRADVVGGPVVFNALNTWCALEVIE